MSAGADSPSGDMTPRTDYSEYQRQSSTGVKRSSVQSLLSNFEPTDRLSHSQQLIERLQENLSTQLKASTVQTLRNSYSPVYSAHIKAPSIAVAEAPSQQQESSAKTPEVPDQVDGKEPGRDPEARAVATKEQGTRVVVAEDPESDQGTRVVVAKKPGPNQRASAGVAKEPESDQGTHVVVAKKPESDQGTRAVVAKEPGRNSELNVTSPNETSRNREPSAAVCEQLGIDRGSTVVVAKKSGKEKDPTDVTTAEPGAKKEPTDVATAESDIDQEAAILDSVEPRKDQKPFEDSSKESQLDAEEKRKDSGSGRSPRVSWTTQLIEKLSEEEQRVVVPRPSRRLARYPGQKDFVPTHIPPVARKASLSPPQRPDKPQLVKPLPPPPRSRSSASSDRSRDAYAELISELVTTPNSVFESEKQPERTRFVFDHSRDGSTDSTSSRRSESTLTDSRRGHSSRNSSPVGPKYPYNTGPHYSTPNSSARDKYISNPSSNPTGPRYTYNSKSPTSPNNSARAKHMSSPLSPNSDPAGSKYTYITESSNSNNNPSRAKFISSPLSPNSSIVGPKYTYSPESTNSNNNPSRAKFISSPLSPNSNIVGPKYTYSPESPNSNNNPSRAKYISSPLSPNSNTVNPKYAYNSDSPNSPISLNRSHLYSVDSKRSSSPLGPRSPLSEALYANIRPSRTSSPNYSRPAIEPTNLNISDLRRCMSPLGPHSPNSNNRNSSPVGTKYSYNSFSPNSSNSSNQTNSPVVPKYPYNSESPNTSKINNNSPGGPNYTTVVISSNNSNRISSPVGSKYPASPLSPVDRSIQFSGDPKRCYSPVPNSLYGNIRADSPARSKSLIEHIRPNIVEKRCDSPAGPRSPLSEALYINVGPGRTNSPIPSKVPIEHIRPKVLKSADPKRCSSPAAEVLYCNLYPGTIPARSKVSIEPIRPTRVDAVDHSPAGEIPYGSPEDPYGTVDPRRAKSPIRPRVPQRPPVVETAFLCDSPSKQNQYNSSRAQARSKSVSPTRKSECSHALEERLHQIRRELSPPAQLNYYAGRRGDVRYQSLPATSRGRPPPQQPIYQNVDPRYAPISVDLERHAISGSPDIRLQLQGAREEQYGSPVLVRGVPQRGTATSSSVQLRNKPIFKRGSLVSVGPASPVDPGAPKRVSFTGSEPSSAWPTRKGPAAQPPTRQHTENAPHWLSESESGSEAGEVQRILRTEEEWNADGKGRGPPGSDHSAPAGGRDEEVRRGGGGGARVGRRDDRRHTLSGDHQHQAGPQVRSMDLEMGSKSQRRKSPLPRGYPPPSTAMLFDEDPGIMSEVETSSTGFRRGGKQRSSLPVVRTPSKTLERPLGLVFLQYRNETKRALLPNEITSIDTVKALFVRSFPKQLTMEYLDSPHVKIYIHDSSKDMFYELEDLRSHLRDIRDRSVLRLFESADMNGGVLPGAGVGVVAPSMWDQDQSYFSEPEFDSEYQHQHIHKTKTSSKASSGVAPQPYYMTHSYPPGGSQSSGAPATLPRGGPLLRAYSPAVAPPVPAERIKSLPQSDRLHSESGYMSSPERGGPRAYPAPYQSGQGYEDPYYSQYASRSGSITPVIDEEASDTELMDESYSLYGVKLPTGRPVAPQPRSQFPTPAVVPYDATRIRVEHMERQLANLTGLVQKALTQTPTPREYLQVPASTRDANYRNDDSYLRTDTKPPKLGKDKSVSFEKSVSFSDEPPDMNSPKQHSPQHTERTERDRHKPAPPPKPVSLSPGQYEGRHVYRDLHLTPEMYNQLRGLQKKAKDLRQEVRNLRRMSQAQAHTVRETIRDTFIKIRTMLLLGGDEAWASAGDADKVRLSREEDAYKQEMLRLEKDLTELESTVEELRGNVINRKTRVNMSDVENMALILSKSSKTVADLKVRFPSLQEGMKSFLSSEMEKVVREEKFLKEEPERLESALRRCKKLTGTLVTLKRLASVQEQRLPPTSGTDGRLSPTLGTDSDPPITPPAHGKPGTVPARGVLASSIGSGSDISLSRQRPENALDALLDELQTFARPPSNSSHNPPMSEIGRKGSIDSAHPSTIPGTSSLRRLHSYPSSSDGGGNSPPTVPLSRLQVSGPADSPKSPATSPKPPVPERNTELLSHLAGRRVPPPPPPRTSSRSPLASPTSPSLPPRGQPQMGVGGGTLLRRGGPGRSSLREPLRGTSGISLPPEPKSSGEETSNIPGTFNPLSASNSSSCESVNSQEGLQNKSGNKARQEILEQRHQELLRKQRALQEQYARLQQLQRGGGGGLTVIPPPDLLLKKTGSESNLLAKMGLGHGLTAAVPISGSLTHLAAVAAANQPIMPQQKAETSTSTTTSTTTTTTTTTNKIYETDIL